MITKTELDGLVVIADLDIDDEDFALSMLEKHLQMAYPDAEIIKDAGRRVKRSLVAIRFANHEDAIHFHLSH